MSLEADTIISSKNNRSLTGRFVDFTGMTTYHGIPLYFPKYETDMMENYQLSSVDRLIIYMRSCSILSSSLIIHI